MQKSTHSQIEWRTNPQGQSQPYSSIFDDVYYSSDNGLLETDYVFLQGNQLAQRWQPLLSNTFTIVETGFGTGLNFLCAVQLWLKTAPSQATLHYISVEKYPLSAAEITTALQAWPALNGLSEPFLAQYQTHVNKSMLLFEKRVQLSLLIGDATDCLGKITEKADAWFLDGFSPAKNPDMWQPALFAQIARLSKTNTTLATFTSAGAVRRGLQAVGFSVNKQAGFGKKREMLTAYFMQDKPSD